VPRLPWTWCHTNKDEDGWRELGQPGREPTGWQRVRRTGAVVGRQRQAHRLTANGASKGSVPPRCGRTHCCTTHVAPVAHNSPIAAARLHLSYVVQPTPLHAGARARPHTDAYTCLHRPRSRRREPACRRQVLFAPQRQARHQAAAGRRRHKRHDGLSFDADSAFVDQPALGFSAKITGVGQPGSGKHMVSAGRS